MLSNRCQINDVTDLIGNTPMIRLRKIASDIDPDIFVKLEYLNPSGSIKDRIALEMINDAEKQGVLRPGMTVVEASTGNTATALAFMGAVRGYPVHVYVPSAAGSEERLRILRSYGAEVTPIDDDQAVLKKGGLHGSRGEVLPRQKCREVEQNDPTNIWWARQFSNPSNTGAHEKGTGSEIVRQTDGKVDAFVGAIGTGGTLLGVARALRKHNSRVRIAAVEPRESSVFDEGGNLNIPIIEGITGGLLKEIADEGIADQIIPVSEDDAIRMAHRLAEEEGLFCGLSSGANVVAALEIAKDMAADSKIVTVLVDSRDRYLFKEQLTT